jgi:type II secretory pathway component PulK
LSRQEKYLNSQKRSISLSLADSRASILIIALWSISLLSMFSIALSYGVRQRATLVKRLDERDKLALILEGGARKAFVELQNSLTSSYDSLKDDWSNDPAVFKGIEIADGELDVYYDYISDDNGLLERRYGIVDEDRKININKIDKPVLERLLQIAIGLNETSSQELAASIIDWRDNDENLSMPIGSAESEYYRNTAYPYEAKNSNIEVLDELLLVKGMTPDMLEKLRDYITVYGEGKINANTASKTVLLALGLNAKISDRIISFRAGGDQVSGTSDDNVFETPADIVSKIGEFARLDDAEMNALGAISGQYLATNSKNFMIKCTAHLKNRKYSSGLSCIMDKDGKIYYWRES